MTAPSTRRQFICHLAVASSALGATAAQAQAGAHVDEASDQAMALGYKHDTKHVDAKKYAQHTPQQRCHNCSFYQGKPTDDWGGCAMFGRKHVAGNGWCSAWNKAPG